MARKRIRTLLTTDADVDVVGEAANGRDAVTAIRERQPDLVFLDVQMPELDGFAVVQAIGVAPNAGDRLRDGVRPVRAQGIRGARAGLSDEAVRS